MSYGIEVTGTYVRHLDDLGHVVSSAILDWERRNPGQQVLELKCRFNRDLIDPQLYITTQVGYLPPEQFDPTDGE